MVIPPKVLFTHYENNKWSEPTEPEFAKGMVCLRPIFSYDDQRIYFASNRPGGLGSQDIWYVEKTDSGFSEPKNLGYPVNSEKFEAQQTFTSDGTVYFNGTMVGKRFNRGILRSRLRHGSYLSPEKLGYPINIMDTNALDYTPFIARDESYLLFCSNRHDVKNEDCRIYISFRDSNDHWSNPVNISEIMGFDFDSRDPYVSPDEKYLFFSSGENIYWVSSRIIDNIKNDYQ